MDDEYDLDNPAVVSFLVKMQEGHQAKLEAQLGGGRHARDGSSGSSGSSSSDAEGGEGGNGSTAREVSQPDMEDDEVSTCLSRLGLSRVLESVRH